MTKTLTVLVTLALCTGLAHAHLAADEVWILWYRITSKDPHGITISSKLSESWLFFSAYSTSQKCQDALAREVTTFATMWPASMPTRQTRLTFSGLVIVDKTDHTVEFEFLCFPNTGTARPTPPS